MAAKHVKVPDRVDPETLAKACRQFYETIGINDLRDQIMRFNVEAGTITVWLAPCDSEGRPLVRTKPITAKFEITSEIRF